jgi:copper chaperone
MKTLTFKTTINCNGCIEKVTPALNALAGEKNWDINISDPKKILSIQSDALTDEEVIIKLKAAGFNAERM